MMANVAEPARLGVLLSGRGSNFLAIQQAISAGELPAKIVAVASDRAGAPGIEAARELGLPTLAVSTQGRRAREAEILAFLEGLGVEWVCLAGYMRLLSADFVARYSQRVVNIHPSLLPAFPGLHAQRQALQHGVRLAGCTVHLVDAGLDTGSIVEQRVVPVAPTDDEASLSARILQQEHLAYPEALRRLLTESWEIEGRRLVFS